MLSVQLPAKFSGWVDGGIHFTAEPFAHLFRCFHQSLEANIADHHDVDIAAREQAERCGLRFQRIDSLNADRGLTDALAAVARRTLETAESLRLAAERS